MVGNSLDLHTDKPHSARIYDYLLGGKDNYPADQKAAAKVEPAVPNARKVARANRDFMHRAAWFAAEAGIGQFLDIGTGIPTAPRREYRTAGERGTAPGTAVVTPSHREDPQHVPTRAPVSSRGRVPVGRRAGVRAGSGRWRPGAG
ncbi:SAM-dependent methyltransferase [Nocardia sp. NPDC058499]|uniref:SAM-dependent methyltransferase n=1 Tax=Nocardia sp. NPDC058499 TaxID=3346530 RepID=UPI00364C6C08